MIAPLRELPGVCAHAVSMIRTVLRDSGEPLRADLRADLEPRFGADFSRVRVHADEAANASARQLNAQAYTVGQHIVFGKDRFVPQTAAGRALLAHELTHAIQQGHTDGVPHETTRSGDAAETAARHHSAQALADAAPRPPAIAPSPPAIAGDEGTAEVVDVVTQFQQSGSAFSARMQRDQFRTHAEAQQALAGGHPPLMDEGFANVSMDATSGAVTIPVSVAVRRATAADTALGPPEKISSSGISDAKVQDVANQFIAECNSGLNNWFTLFVPPCQGVPFAGRELPITVKVTRTSAANPDFAVAVSSHTGRSFVSHDDKVVVLYAGDIGATTMRHEGTHMVLGAPDEYEESDAALRRQAPLQKGEQRVRHDWTLAGDSAAWGIFSVLRARHFSFVPVFAQQVLTSLGHLECMPVLHEVTRPQPHLLRLTLGEGYSGYGGGALHVEAGADVGWFLDRERDWRAFLGVHGHVFLPGAQPNAYLFGARLGLEHKWRSSRLGPTAEAFAETGAAFETGTGARAAAPFAGAGASLGISFWAAGNEWQLKLTGGEVLRLDREGYNAFQAGFLAGLSW
jgi:hypothetical protein